MVKMDKIALAAIYQSIPDDVVLSLVEKNTCNKALESINTMHMGADRL